METQKSNLTSLREYLKKSKHSIPAANFAQQILNNFQQGIKSGIIRISQQQKPFTIVEKTQLSELQLADKRLQQILDKKQAIKKEMNWIQSEQERIMFTKLSQSKVSSNKYFKSKMTPEDVEKLKNLYKAKKNFENQLQHKTKKYQQNLKKFQMEEKRKIETQKNMQHQKKKQQIQKSIQMMEKRREEQRNIQAQENKKLKSLLQQKKLYEEMQKKWKEVEEEEEKQKSRIKEEMKKIKRIDFQQIKQHEKKYQETIRVQRQSRIKNTPSFELDQSRSHYQSRFIDSIKEQELKKKQLEQFKRTKMRQLSQKKKQYGEQVRTVHKPKKFIKKDDKQNYSKIPEIENRSLSLFQTHEKGNLYMRQINAKLAEDLKQHPQKAIKNQEPKAFKYKNYLAQIKSNKTSNSDRKEKFHQITKVMNNSHITQDEKLFKAKLLAEKIQNNRGDRQSDQNLVTSINAKLAILKQLQ